MNALQRISLSLLITVILSSIVVFVAFTGLFSYFELEFFNKRVQQINQNELDLKIQVINAFHEKYRKRFGLILEGLDIQKIYTSQWDEEYITKFHNLIRLFEVEFHGIQFIWFYDEKYQIHYSSEDFAEKNTSSSFRKVYKNAEEASQNVINYSLLINNKETDYSIQLDSIGEQILYKFAVIDDLGLKRGTALIVVSISDLRRHLIESGSLEIDGKISIYDGGYIFGGAISNVSELAETSTKWDKILTDSTRIYTDSVSGDDYVLLSKNVPELGNIAELIKVDDYKLDEFLKIFLLISFFLTTYLIIFLIFNLKQDKIVIINGRIKKLQTHFLKEFIENRDNLDIKNWQKNLRYKGDLVKSDIRRGIGRIKKDKAEKIDNLIDKSWSELLEVIDNKIAESSKGTLEISNLEDVLKRIIEASPGIISGKAAVAVKKSPIEELEELDEVEALEELEELDEVEAPEEMEELDEAEVLEEVEEPDEVEALEE
ncbi:MAG: hypothetical protein KAR21_01590, partial [Spirochaetales bacterium]|nr:hypothetical protein [Spirochaetales bacterium]